MCVCKLLERFKCLNLGSILTICSCHTWEMTAQEAFFSNKLFQVKFKFDKLSEEHRVSIV